MKLGIIFKKIAKGLFFGSSKSEKTTYSGPDFSEVKEYDPLSDPAKSIDWKSSLKKRKLMVKVKDAEKNFQSIFLVDSSSSFTDFSTADTSKKDLASYIISILSYELTEIGSQVGLMLFSDKIEKMVDPQFGSQSTRNIIKVVKDLQKNPEKKTTLLKIALKHIYKSVHKPAMLFIISDCFFEPSENYKKILAGLNQKHDIVSIVIRDRSEETIPDIFLGEYYFKDLESSQIGNGHKIQTDNEFQMICRQFNISTEIFFTKDSKEEIFKKLRKIFLAHTKRRI